MNKRMRYLVYFLCGVGCGLLSHVVHARDPDGRFAASPLKSWFDSLRSGKGPCCSDADGNVVKDADWEVKNGHYRVRLDVSQVADKVIMDWVDVPDEAVLRQPNLYGPTMVWPIKGYLGVSVRCFLPGTMG